MEKKVEKTTRETVAERVGREFRELSEEDKLRFVNATLKTLMVMNPKQAKKMIKKFFKRGRPNIEDLESINQLVITFPYSIKEEFRNQWAFLTYRALNQPIPESLPEKIELAMNKRYLHIGLSPETYGKVMEHVEKLGTDSWEKYFNHLLSEKAEG